MTGGNGAWRIAGASVRGASHTRSGKPNQDSVIWSPASGLGSRIAAAVSDGHGASAHFRSDIGSRLAVEQAAERMSRHLEGGDGDEQELVSDILGAWRAAVSQHLAENPIDGGDGSLGPYGATLLALGADEDEMTVLQIGDGDLMLGYPDGRIERALRPDEGLVGEQTYSLCQADAEQRFRVASFWRAPGSPWPCFVLLSTDGLAKSYESDAAFETAVASLRDLAVSDFDGLMAGVADWLTDVSTRGSGDDTTICIATLTPSSDEKAQP